MARRIWAAVAVMTLLCGFAAAPYTHAHRTIDSASDNRHPHGQTLVHTHASPHAHQGADRHERGATGEEDGDDQVWAVESFICQQPAPTYVPPAALVAFGELLVRIDTVWLGVDRPRPTAHGPPVGLPSGLRAPPAFLPAFA